MKRALFRVVLLVVCVLSMQACMEYGAMDTESFNLSKRGVFITCEGNFCYGNASLSVYIPEEKRVENEIFVRANGVNLGDVAQSMTIHNKLGYVVVNNSGVIYIINTDTFEAVGSITGVVSPRYIHFIDDTKAYITDLYDPNIAIVDVQSRQIIGHIPTGGHKSTEQMAQYGKYLFVNCWSYDDKILVIDTDQDKVVESITVSRQPTSITIDKRGKLWVLTDGRGSSITAALYRIDAATFAIEKRFDFRAGETPSALTIDGNRDVLYFINESVWRMNVGDESLPDTPFIAYRKTIYYAIAIDPLTADVYVSDAIDYVQPGVVYRFSTQGDMLDKFRVGITPGAFCFKSKNP